MFCDVMYVCFDPCFHCCSEKNIGIHTFTAYEHHDVTSIHTYIIHPSWSRDFGFVMIVSQCVWTRTHDSMWNGRSTFQFQTKILFLFVKVPCTQSTHRHHCHHLQRQTHYHRSCFQIQRRCPSLPWATVHYQARQKHTVSTILHERIQVQIEWSQRTQFLAEMWSVPS